MKTVELCANKIVVLPGEIKTLQHRFLLHTDIQNLQQIIHLTSVKLTKLTIIMLNLLAGAHNICVNFQFFLNMLHTCTQLNIS